jgi:hypothetical protein
MTNIANDHIYEAGADAQEWVQMKHPELDGTPAPVTREAYEQVWKHKGFHLVEGSEQVTTAPVPIEPEALTDYESVTREEVVAYANAHGGNFARSASKQEAWDHLVSVNLAVPRQEG